MSKKLTSLLLTFVMIFSLLAVAGPAYSKSTEPAISISVVPDKTEVSSGDTISYQVILGPVNNWADCEFTFVIPEGLTYVSAAVSDVVAAHFQGGWAESTKRFVIYGGKYTSSADTLLLTVTCKVEESAAGSDLKIVLNDPFFCDKSGEDYVINGYDEGVSLDFDSGNSVTVKEPQTGYTVSFDGQGGSGTMADVTGVSGEYTLPACGFTAPEGKTFKCWSVNGEMYHVGENIPVTEDTTVSAVWVCNHDTLSDWKYDGEYHWKTCIDCSIVIETTKEGHISTGANEATCQKQAVCNVCGVSYGTTAPHDLETTLSRDETGHWYGCKNPECEEKFDFEGHTPDHNGGATEEYGIKCTVCGYEMEAQLTHTHVFDKEVATDTYKASGATCTAAATYYFSCKCGEKGSETFFYGEALGHTAGGDWQKNATHHWKVCVNAGCGVVVEETKVAHTPDHEGGATEEYGIKCTVCGYEMEAQLAHTHVFDKEVATDTYKASGATCTAAATYYFSCKCGEKGSDTFFYGEALGHTAGGDWQKNATHHWKVCVNAGCGVVVEETKVAHTPDHEGGATEEYGIKCTVCGYEMEAQLAHTHVFDKEVATDTYKASGATCTAAATYYFSCKCGEKGSDTFSYGEALGHHEGNLWQMDDDNHWKTCQNENCGVIIDETVEAHMDENEDGYCDVCNCNVGSGSPETGDNEMLLFVLLFIASLAAAALVVVKKKANV